MLRRRRRSWWRGRATTSARRRKTDRRDHVRGARRSRPRGPSSRVDRSSAALGRGLFFPTRFFLVFCLPARRRRRRDASCGFGGLCFDKDKAVLVRPVLALLGLCEHNNSDIVAASRERVRNGQRPALTPIAAGNRCTPTAQELSTRRGTTSVTQQWMRQENRCPSSPSAD